MKQDLSERPSLEAVANGDHQYKISKELKESIKKNNDSQRKTGQFFNFTFNQDMNPNEKSSKPPSSRKRVDNLNNTKTKIFSV